jgi:hypothetical protein
MRSSFLTGSCRARLAATPSSIAPPGAAFSAEASPASHARNDARHLGERPVRDVIARPNGFSLTLAVGTVMLPDEAPIGAVVLANSRSTHGLQGARATR